MTAATRTALVLGALMATTLTAQAHSNSAYRFDRQADRIETGRQTGAITWREGIKLRREQKKIMRVENSLKSDGYYSKSDKRVVSKLQNESSRHITREAHDGWRRLWWLPRVGR